MENNIIITQEQFAELVAGNEVIIANGDSTLTISAPVAVELRIKNERDARVRQLMKEMKEETDSDEAVVNREVEWGTSLHITSEMMKQIREERLKEHKIKQQNNSALFKGDENAKD